MLVPSSLKLSLRFRASQNASPWSCRSAESSRNKIILWLCELSWGSKTVWRFHKHQSQRDLVFNDPIVLQISGKRERPPCFCFLNNISFKLSVNTGCCLKAQLTINDQSDLVSDATEVPRINLCFKSSKCWWTKAHLLEKYTILISNFPAMVNLPQPLVSCSNC